MNKRQVERYMHLINTLGNVGIDKQGVDILLKCERRLQRWGERECNGEIERLEDGKCFKVWFSLNGKRHSTPCSDLETKTLALSREIASNAKGYRLYHQADPRGCALYLVKDSLCKDHHIDSVYSQGIALCL